LKDTLTGLDNYEEFVPKLQSLIDSLDDRVIVIDYSDIKHFKYFNDTYSYKTGNDLLADYAKLLIENNENFLYGSRVVSDNMVTVGVYDLYNKEDLHQSICIRNRLIENALRKKYKCNRLRICTGMYFITKENNNIDAETVISNCNLARKIARENAREDSVVIFKEEMSSNINHEIEILSTIDSAIKNNELIAYYQPKINSETGIISGAEALVRWKKPDGTIIYPDQFVPIIERSGQIIQVDYFMYQQVFQFINERIAEGKSIVPISINVSRQHFKKLDIINYVKSLQRVYNIPPKYVEFEITETVCMTDTVKALNFIRTFHEMGFKVSMDDFGSGYSSLYLLSELPIDIIKMDKCFLQTEQLKQKERVIISNVINMTHELDIQTLCEGVETPEQSEFLKSVGCDIQQGFYFSRPVTREQLQEIL
jgi:EAL domain-containing protein (putative c-di-GMP-specific phosphodiesterase class I)/GGDEF domain-containing protein